MDDIDTALSWLSRLFGPFQPSDGVDATLLDNAEVRLACVLPTALRQLYLRTGAHAGLHAAHNRLLAPAALTWRGDHLVFYEENQEVVSWGIARADLHHPNPPVAQAAYVHGQPLTFFSEFPSLSLFVAAQGAWQAVQGGLPFVGAKNDAPPTMTSSITARVGPPACSCVSLQAWSVDDGVLVLAGNYVGLATHHDETFIAESERAGIALEDWDYTTFDDDEDDDD